MEIEEARSLVAAVSKAMGQPIDPDTREGYIAIQTGCCILNYWGVEPEYDYRRFVWGPISDELTDDLENIGIIDGSVTCTHVSDKDVEELGQVFGHGLTFAEAYSAVLIAKRMNPHLSTEGIRRLVCRILPNYEGVIDGVMTCLRS